MLIASSRMYRLPSLLDVYVLPLLVWCVVPEEDDDRAVCVCLCVCVPVCVCPCVCACVCAYGFVAE